MTTRRIVDQRWAGPGASAPPRVIALHDVLAVADRPRGAGALFSTHALVVALADGTTPQWGHLTNHQIEPAAAAIERARRAALISFRPTGDTRRDEFGRASIGAAAGRSYLEPITADELSRRRRRHRRKRVDRHA